ncbi:Ig-like domain-containing protein [Rhodococcus sp. NPDC058514]|uniref:Ig-like domain-containing protein n=1 Tax=unclassified Rhodococcus (in: high G+C Gram-positive bacteria) TaxID=192944 RepID=UPI00365AFB21
MLLSLTRRLATPLVTAGAAMTLMLGGAGTAVAQPTPPPPAWSGDKTADNLRWNLSLSAVNGTAVDRAQAGVNVVHPGDTVTYTAKVWKNNGTDRLVTAMRQIQPDGFQYVSNTVSKQASVVDEGAAGVKATCSGGGCGSVFGFGSGFKNDVTFAVTYKIPTTQAFGDYNAGFEFDVYSFSTGQGANPAGAWVRVVDPKVATNTTLQAPATAQTGQAVTLTANVGPANSAGTVQFKDGSTDIGAPAAVSGGVATLSHTFDTPGAHAITAAFTGGAGFHDSVSAAATVDVTAETTTTVNVPATATVGDDVTFTATVAPATATGRVQFKDGATDLGTPVDVVNGQAPLTRKFAEAGSHNVTANFVGTGGYGNSASAASPLAVTDADFGTTTTVLEPVTATTGTPVNLSATVMPIPSGGDVEFLVDGVPVGTAPVGTGDGVAILPHTFTAAGTASVVAKFIGVAGFTPSTSAGFDVTVKAPDTRVATTTTLGVTGAAAVGKTMTFTATVAPASATGTVQFKVGTEAVGAPVPVVNGVATLTHTFDAEGTHGITAVYSGDNGHKESVSGPTVVNIVASTPGTPGGSGSADLGSLSSLFGS